MNIPLIDLKAQYKEIGDQLDKAVLDVLRSTHYIIGSEVKSFEKEIAEYCGVKHAIGVGNGTDALVIALKAMGIGEGDEVITTPFTFFASSESISFVGATPVFVDVEKDSFNIDPSLIEEKITNKTKAIMPVHIFGQTCKMDEINEIAERHNLLVIEDACQAIGANYKGRKAGSLGDIACFSFFPTKNLGAAGDGGMIVTDSDELALICRALRTHGSGEAGKKALSLLNEGEIAEGDDESQDNTIYNPLKYYNYLIGHNSRLDEMQAALLRVKLRKLNSWNEGRSKVAQRYNQAFQDTGLVTPKCIKEAEHVYHLYILQSEDRQSVTDFLKEKGIATGVYYPVPLHLQKVYSSLGYQLGDLPVAEYLSERTFAIPVYPELSEEQLCYIIDALHEWMGI